MVKLGRRKIEVLGALELLRQCRGSVDGGMPVTITSGEIYRGEPTLRTKLKDAKAVGDAMGRHGLKLARHPSNNGFITSRENLEHVRNHFDAIGVADELVNAAGCPSLVDLDAWIATRPSSDELVQQPVSTRRAKSSRHSKVPTTDELRGLIRASEQAREASSGEISAKTADTSSVNGEIDESKGCVDTAINSDNAQTNA